MHAQKNKTSRRSKAPHRIVGGRPLIAHNHRQRQFYVDPSDQAWDTGVADPLTWKGRVYLEVVIDLHSRKVFDRSMKPARIAKGVRC